MVAAAALEGAGRRRQGDSQVTTDFKRRQIVGRGIPVTGNDIDTDRIIPARFLKAVTFETMGEHAFEDARKQNPEHPFNSPAYKGASVLVVGQNFGCGSSREHAPQALIALGHPRDRGWLVRRNLRRQLRDPRHPLPPRLAGGHRVAAESRRAVASAGCDRGRGESRRFGSGIA